MPRGDRYPRPSAQFGPLPAQAEGRGSTLCWSKLALPQEADPPLCGTLRLTPRSAGPGAVRPEAPSKFFVTVGTFQMHGRQSPRTYGYVRACARSPDPSQIHALRYQRTCTLTGSATRARLDIWSDRIGPSGSRNEGARSKGLCAQTLRLSAALHQRVESTSLVAGEAV